MRLQHWQARMARCNKLEHWQLRVKGAGVDLGAIESEKRGVHAEH